MGKSLIPAQRRERIQSYLASHKIVATTKLCTLLDVSEATIRRDLEWLDHQGLIERTHGGAIRSERINLEPAYRQRAQRFPEAKRRIGGQAASLLQDGDIVFINSGTTTTQVIRHIRPDLKITILTNNLMAAFELGEVSFDLILIGGSFQPRSNSVAGRYAIENLSHVYADKAIIGVDGISLKYGCTVPSDLEAEIVQRMIERTHGRITVVADCSKWGVVSNFEVASISNIHAIITDEGLDPGACAALEARSVEVVVASAHPKPPDVD